MDTVGIEGMTDPFSAEIRNGKLFGRGAQDMKGSIAAMLSAVRALTEGGIQLKGDLIFAAVADEEYGSIGTEALVKSHNPDAAIVTEPTNLHLCLAHRGFCVFEVETKGRAAHGSSYREGIDANLHMGRILAELEKLSQNLLDREKHPLLGPPSLHVPLIKGGTELFIYSDECKISVERRTLPGETLERLLHEMETIIARLTDEDKRFNAHLKTVIHRNAYEISPDAEIVKTVTEVVSRVLGRTPDYIGHHWWEDSALIAEAGTETVIIGPRGEGLHSHEEWVDIQSVVDLATILAETAIRFCG
jgi:acetylornithine deacetylase